MLFFSLPFVTGRHFADRGQTDRSIPLSRYDGSVPRNGHSPRRPHRPPRWPDRRALRVPTCPCLLATSYRQDCAALRHQRAQQRHHPVRHASAGHGEATSVRRRQMPLAPLLLALPAHRRVLRVLRFHLHLRSPAAVRRIGPLQEDTLKLPQNTRIKGLSVVRPHP
jgi:hypothetical protein